ncbi:cobalt ECF transporter T component CbiQ [Azospirillum halopraeferens]|uniref:cobalt ECF transporter T component CbiQ n=1 Tax=Azospirillum halopraeferens TaxID=34010 RepID=UPI0004033627|nr:cobalt ECF transporter T component CbiQ [Azospirillum halopraeferens]
MTVREPVGGGLVAALDPRTRVVTAAAFAVVAVALGTLPALAAALGFAALLAVAARLPLWRTLRTLAALDGVVALALLTLPFTVPGAPWLTVAGLTATWEGVERALAILMTANAVVLALLALVGTMDVIVLGRTLARLGAPEKLVHLLLFTVRTLDVLEREYRRLRTAMRARAFRAGTNRHTWRTLGWLFGMLIVRAVERADRVVAAMRCRGFDGRLRSLEADGGFRRGDGVFAVASAAGMVLVAVVGRL